MLNSIDLNVVIIPDARVVRQPIELSRKIASIHDVEFTLNTKNCHPHLTLYQGRFPTDGSSEYRRIRDTVEGVADCSSPFQLVLQGFSSFIGIIFWDAIRNRDLVALHMELVHDLSPQREGHLLPIHEQLLTTDIPERKKQSIRNWGNPMCLDEFEPHISLSRLQDSGDVTAAIDVLEPESITFTVDAIAIGTIGPHGTCPDILHRFPLGG